MDDVFQSCTTDELGLALATREISAMNETRMSISQPAVRRYNGPLTETGDPE